MVEVDLTLEGIELPSATTGMVLAQPYLELGPEEPFRSTSQSTPQHLEAIVKTLDVARTAPHGAEKTHFTLLPEYSIPAAQGIPRIEDALRSNDWPNRTIVIGGVDGLTIPEYEALVATPHTTVDRKHNNPKTIPAGQWVNCAIVWTKGRDGSVKRWLQPKLYPAWPEEDATVLSMFRGSSVFVFRGRFSNGAPYRFAVLVCYDWVATIDGHKPWETLLEELSRQASPHEAELSLSWLFVIQHNEKPSHPTFLTEIDSFFDQTTTPTVRRDRTCIVFANSAGGPGPGRTEHHGHTSLVLAQETRFTPSTCPLTFCNGGQSYRERDLIRHHKDILFRERGACIHSFAQVNPASLVPGAAGRAAPLRCPAVFPINEQPDPRALGAPVPASAKWLNDELDTLPGSAPHQGRRPPGVISQRGASKGRSGPPHYFPDPRPNSRVPRRARSHDTDNTKSFRTAPHRRRLGQRREQSCRSPRPRPKRSRCLQRRAPRRGHGRSCQAHG